MPSQRMLNWLCRYAVATSTFLDERRQLTTSLLDVGSGPHGFASADPRAPFVGVDTEFPLRPASTMLAIRNAPGPLPFADGSFGAVVSLDVLEHVPPGDRSAFVSELARVCAGRALVACPSSEMGPIDDVLRTMFARARVPVPGWLSEHDEHDEHGLPTPEEIAEHCTPPAGYRTRPVPVPNGMLSTMASLADFTPETAAAAASDATAHTANWLEVFEQSSFGDSWRKAYVIEREEPVRPLVHRDALEETTLAVLRCPCCASAFERLGPALLRCTGCRQLAPRDRQGIWDLRPGTRPLWCEPEWRPDALSPLLRGFAELDDARTPLVLRARPGIIDETSAHACASAALGGRKLPEHLDVIVLTEALSPADEQLRRADAIEIDEHLLDALNPVSTR